MSFYKTEQQPFPEAGSCLSVTLSMIFSNLRKESETWFWVRALPQMTHVTGGESLSFSSGLWCSCW